MKNYLFVLLIIVFSCPSLLFAQSKIKYYVEYRKTIYKDTLGNVIRKKAYYKLYNSNLYDSKPIILDTTKNKIDELQLIKLTPEQAELKKTRGSKFRTVGTAAPLFDFKDINGNKINLAELKGKVVVLNFWFLECSPCVKELPELNKLVETHQGKDIVFISFVRNQADKVSQFLVKTPFKYSIVEATDKEFLRSYGIAVFPTNIVIDKNGNFYFQSTGYSGNVKDLEKAIKKSLTL